jgi:hypothetical protein
VNLTGVTFEVTTESAPITVREFVMSNGKTKGLAVPCPCGRDILVDPRKYKVSVVAGKLTVTPNIVCYCGPGREACGCSLRITNGAAEHVEAP